MENQELETAVLEYVNQPGYRPQKPRTIAKRMGLDEDVWPAVQKTVKQLVKRGQLEWGTRHLVKSTKTPTTAKRSDDDCIVGTFRRTDRGDGHVRPQSHGSKKARDVHVSGPNASDAATGDTVSVRLSNRRGRGGLREGRIVEILERRTTTFVGTFLEERGGGQVKVDGKVFGDPIPLGDPGAKRPQVGDRIVVEIVTFPSYDRSGEAVISEVLGAHGTPGIDTLAIIREFGLPEEFPDAVLDEAREIVAKFSEDDLADRLDLRDQTIVTIDPEDARDFDDAISLDRLDGGHWRLGVHIADVAHFVPEGSALDVEALDRGTSVYLPDRVIPMLPELISNGVASLQPHRMRYAKTVFVEFSSDGIPVDVEVHRSAIKSDHRFTYEQVDDYLEQPSKWKKELSADVHALVARMHNLAMILRQRRLGRGALELSIPEVRIQLDADGEVAGAVRVENTVSHQIIEEFMLAANEAVATVFDDAEWPFMRRNHPPPDERKLQEFSEFVSGLGLSDESLVDRFAIQRLLAKVTGEGEEYAVHFGLLRSMNRAVYGTEPTGHYALAIENYCHFTSPIRRYPDLTIHREINDWLAGKSAPPEPPLAAAAIRCSEREQRAESAERELTKVKLLAYMAERQGETLTAVITGVESFGIFAQGVEIPAEGFVHVTQLEGDYYDYDRVSHTLTGRQKGDVFRLGDRIQVEVASVDTSRRELDFRVLTHESRRRPKSGNSRAEAKRSRAGRGKRERKAEKTRKRRRR